MKTNRNQAVLAKERQEIEQKITLLREAADKVEIIEAAVEMRFWKEILLPKLDADIEAFEKGAWSFNAEDFAERKAGAIRSRAIKDHILTQVGKRDKYLKEAERLATLIERFDRQGH